MAADYVDALLGYEYFLENQGKVTRDQINKYLTGKGHRPIQHRTFIHYKNLFDSGFRNYMSINRFDVTKSLGNLPLAAERRRYSRNKRFKQVEISKNGIDWISASLKDISLVGFGIIAPRFSVQPDDKIIIRLEDYSDIPCSVVWKKHSDKFTEIGVRAFEFIAKYELPGKAEEIILPTGHLIITRPDKGELRWDNFLMILSRVNQVLTATDELIYEIANQTNTEIRLPQPIVQSIKFGSPWLLDIIAALSSTKILEIIFQFVGGKIFDPKRYQEETRKNHLVTNGIELDYKMKTIDLEYYEKQKKQDIEKTDIEIADLKTESMRKRINLYKDAQNLTLDENTMRLIQELTKTTLNSQLPEGSFEKGTLERNMIENRILPPALILAGGEDPAIELNVSTEDPSKKDEENPKLGKENNGDKDGA